MTRLPREEEKRVRVRWVRRRDGRTAREGWSGRELQWLLPLVPPLIQGAAQLFTWIQHVR